MFQELLPCQVSIFHINILEYDSLRHWSSQRILKDLVEPLLLGFIQFKIVPRIKIFFDGMVKSGRFEGSLDAVLVLGPVILVLELSEIGSSWLDILLPGVQRIFLLGIFRSLGNLPWLDRNTSFIQSGAIFIMRCLLD